MLISFNVHINRLLLSYLSGNEAFRSRWFYFSVVLCQWNYISHKISQVETVVGFFLLMLHDSDVLSSRWISWCVGRAQLCPLWVALICQVYLAADYALIQVLATRQRILKVGGWAKLPRIGCCAQLPRTGDLELDEGFDRRSAQPNPTYYMCSWRMLQAFWAPEPPFSLHHPRR